MITIETTTTCATGFASIIALEVIGEPYEVKIFDAGHFLSAHGAPGPRLVDGSDVLFGRAVARTLMKRCADARGASEATAFVLEHLATRVEPAIDALVRGGDETKGLALRTAMTELEALVDAVPDADLASEALAPSFAIVERLLARVPAVHAFAPRLAERVGGVGASGAAARARARMAAVVRGSDE